MTALLEPTSASTVRERPRQAMRVSGLGIALPSRRVTNQDLTARLDTSDAWIVGRTGIRARRVAGAEDSTVSLAVAAARRAIEDASVARTSIDLIVIATTTPDSACPSTAARVGAELGLRAGGFDVNGACCGFVHAVQTAAALLAGPTVTTALVIGVDRYTSLTDPDDRSTSILFGDGAGAVVLTSAAVDPGAPGILGSDLGGDPGTVAVIEVPTEERWLAMDGPELFRRAVRAMVTSSSAALGRASATSADVDLFVPHQANARIIGAAADRLGIEFDRVVVDVAERANTSAASIPLALHTAREEGRLRDGDRVLISAVGAGLAWASLFLRWSR